MTITLPEPLAAWVAERAARLGYESADAYVADLVQREADSDLDDDPGPAHLTPRSREELDRMLEEGLQGEPIVADEAFWENQRAKLAERIAARKQAKQS
jgi:hypothetical protein